ncbi:GspH/FimT family pseudopilin [Vibrio nomapromontoriensis]|uniref:GspH/FimT family pseudopilin n=1 Tax=Vibrio nomapromontoriensis TaxID=2910246 RepID=UPI003D142321
MVRGFTLLELMISVFVMMILMLSVAPSFSGLSKEVKVERAAAEIYGLLMQTKAEAIMRNEPLWSHFNHLPQGAEDGSWSISVTNSSTTSGTTFLALSGLPYQNVHMHLNHNSKQIKFDNLTGVVLSTGTITISPYSQQNSGIKIKTSAASGRIVVCQFGDAEHGVGECSV